MKNIFTLVGGHISPILVACEKLGIRVVDTRHEVRELCHGWLCRETPLYEIKDVVTVSAFTLTIHRKTGFPEESLFSL